MPETAAGVEVRRRRMPGRADMEVPADQVHHKVHCGRESLGPALPVQIVVGGREELLRRYGAEESPERAGQLQCTRGRVHALARYVDEHKLEPLVIVGEGGDDEVATEGCAAGGS